MPCVLSPLALQGKPIPAAVHRAAVLSVCQMRRAAFHKLHTDSQQLPEAAAGGMRAFKTALCISLSGAHFCFPMFLMACSWFLAFPGYAGAPLLTIRLTARMLAKP